MTSAVLDTPLGRFAWHEDWVTIPTPRNAEHEGRTHGVVVSRSGRIYIFRQAVPGIFVFEADGRLVDTWGNYPGAHGLTLVEENGQEFLWLSDQERLTVEKTTLGGEVVQQIEAPTSASHKPYVPTWVAVNETRIGGNGDIWVADGYGSSLVHRYDATGNYTSTLDGTKGAGRFVCPHGIWFDSRKEPMELYVADRGNRRVQIFDVKGNYLRSFGMNLLTSPDGFVSNGNLVIIPELEGRVTVLDVTDQLVCHLGNNGSISKDPLWPNETLLFPGKFNSPHSAAVDRAGNIFVVEWRKGGRIIKLEKLS